MKTTRRDFIKISAIGAGGLSMSSLPFVNLMPGLFDEDQLIPDDSKLKRIPTYCEVCFWKCAAWAYVNDEGKIVKLVGNENDQHSSGRLCPRGTGGLGMMEDKDRLTKPLIRTGEPGSQTFKEATWDEAFDFIVDKMKKIDKKYGKESMALFHHGTTGPHFEHLFKAFGSDSIAEPAIAQCLVPREVGFKSTFGKGLSSPEPTDIRNTRCLVLIGNHIGENMHNGHVQEMSEAIDNGATIITVDPRFSTAASKSKYWLPIRPATDIALLLSWIHVIINEKLYDKEYVEKYTYGFDLLKNHVKNFTPKWAYTKTDIEPHIIRETAREMAGAAPAVIIHPGRHTVWYGDDTQRARAMAILNALLGSYGRKGGIYFPEKKRLPKFPIPNFEEPKWTWKDITKDKYKLAPLGVTNVLIDYSLPENKSDKQIKGWFVTATNIIVSIPDMKKTIKAIQNLDLLVAVDTMPSEITGYADVVLPEAVYLERFDYARTSQHRRPNVALRMPVVKPAGDSKPGWWIARELGIRLGLEEYFPWKNIEEVLDWQFKKVGTSLEEMKKIGIKDFDKEDYLYIPEGAEWEFNTPSGKIELFSNTLAAEGYPGLPNYTEHKQNPQGFYRLIYGRVPMHTFGRTVNNPYLSTLRSENRLWINPKVAKDWGIEDGQEVWLENQDGVVSSFSVKVRITERINSRAVYLPHGFGSTGKKLSRAYGKGVSDSEMITNVKIDPETGATGMRENFVTLLLEKPEKEAKPV